MSQSAKGPLWASCSCGRILPSQYLYLAALSLWRLETPCSWLETCSPLAQSCAWLTTWALCSWWEWSTHRHGQAVVFLHWALHSSGALPDQPKYGSGHSVPGSLDPSRVPTRSPCTSYKVTWLSTWFSAASFRTGTPQMMLTLYRRIWLKEKNLHYYFELVQLVLRFTKRIT